MGITDTFSGTNGSSPDSGKWTPYTSSGSTVDIQSNALRLLAAAVGSYAARAQVTSTSAVLANLKVAVDVTPQGTGESYFLIPMRASTSDSSIDGTCYKWEVGSWGGLALSKISSFTATSLGSQSIFGYAAGTVVHIEVEVNGSTLTGYAWTGSTKPSTPTIQVTDSTITAAGYTGLMLVGGADAAAKDWRVDNYALTVGGQAVTIGRATTTSTAFPIGATNLYDPSTSVIANPERGFFQYTETHYQSDSSGHSALSSSALSTSRAADSRSIVFRYFVIEKYLSLDTIDSTYLALVAADLAAVRAAGCKAVIRFTYSTAGNISSPPYGDDPPVARVLGHISQLAATINTYADVVYAVQAGFIGMWGEWYYTDNFGDVGTLNSTNWTDRTSVLNALVDNLDARIYVLVRYPGVKLHIYGNPATDPRAARVGFHNDAFLADFEDYGTYTTFTSLSASGTRAYVAAQAGAIPSGGESAATNGTHSLGPSAITDLSTYHWTFLNPLYHPDVLNSWTTAEKAEISRNLGYRLRLVSATLPPAAAAGGSYKLRLTLVNDGYAALTSDRPVQVQFVGATTVTRELTVDPRTWMPGSPIVVSETIVAPPMAGSYDLYLRLPDPTSALQAISAYSIQLANVGTWDGTNGRNNLGQTITVSSSSPLTIGRAAEVDTATAVARSKRRTIGQAVESGSSTLVSRRKTRVVSGATSPETASAVTRVKRQATGQPSTTDTALVGTRSRRRTLSQPTSVSTAPPLGKAKARALGQAGEADAGQQVIPHVVGNNSVLVGTGVESGTGVAVARRKIRMIGQASSIEEARPASRAKVRTVGLPTDPSLAQGLGRVKLRLLGRAVETTTAPSGLARRKTRAIDLANQAESARPVFISFLTPVAIGRASGVSIALPLARKKTLVVSRAIEFNTARLISHFTLVAPRSGGRQPFWQRQPELWAEQQVADSHLEALLLHGEFAMFVLLWHPADYEAGLVERCPRCWAEGTMAARVAAVYQQPYQQRCPVCFGTTFEGGYRAKIVRPSLWTDSGTDTVRHARGDQQTDSMAVESTGDFTMRHGDYVFRSDGTRFLSLEMTGAWLRTGMARPARQRSIGGSVVQVRLEDPGTAAYDISPTAVELATGLDLPALAHLMPDLTTHVGYADSYSSLYVYYESIGFEDIRGPLIVPEIPQAAAT